MGNTSISTHIYLDKSSLNLENVTNDRQVSKDIDKATVADITLCDNDDHYMTPSKTLLAIQTHGVTGGNSGSDYRVERFVLSASDISNKCVTLSILAEPNSLILRIKNAPGQYINDDFIYDPLYGTLTWNECELESVLEIGDKLTISYNAR